MSPAEREPAARPTVFLPVEIKLREFRAKLLLAAVAARAGMRAYVGTKSAVATAIGSRPQCAGIYFAKGGDRLDVARTAKSHCERLVVLDEELGPALAPDGVRRMWVNRSTVDVEAEIDRIFVFSAAHEEVLRDIRPSLQAKTAVTGWPRVDLWREFRTADERRAAELRERHGPFVLFASNFKVSSEAQRQHRIATARAERDRLPEAARAERADEDDYGSFATARLEGFHRAVPVLRELAGELDDADLVVRPHPAENPEDWQRALGDVPGVSVMFEGEAGPWLLASRALLHTGCTTAVEAALYGVPCGYLAQVGYLADSFVDTPSYRVSQHLGSADDVSEFLAKVEAEGGQAPYELSERDLGPQQGRAVDRIVDELLALDTTPEPPLPLGRAVAWRRWAGERYRRLKRLVPRPGRRRFYGTNAQPKVPGGLHRPEAHQLLVELGIDDVEVTEPAPNLLCIEASAPTPRGPG